MDDIERVFTKRSKRRDGFLEGKVYKFGARLSIELLVSFSNHRIDIVGTLVKDQCLKSS